MKYITFNNSNEVPVIGFGTYFVNVLDTDEAVYTALICGYRHLDTAKWYNNEERVARAIERSGIERDSIFLTSKVESKGYDLAIKDVEDTLKKFNTNYLDLVIIHWPEGDILGTYKALEYLYKKGKIRNIGLSNFNENLCEYIINNCEIFPQINQIETHIYFQEKKMNSYLELKKIVHESWSPFAEGLMNVFEDVTLKEIARKYNKSVSQIILRFFVQKNIVVIPKSINFYHIKENIEIFDFELEKEDVLRIEKLDKKKQCSGWPCIMEVETKY